MDEGLVVKPGLVIPLHELIFTTSRSGGAGGQHVNKTDSRVTVHWNIVASSVLNQAQKELLIQKLSTRMTLEGKLVVHNDTTRSQLQNKIAASNFLAELVRNALKIVKKRIKTTPSLGVKEARISMKKRRGSLKKNRQIKPFDE